jgi:hypothetical protein
MTGVCFPAEAKDLFLYNPALRLTQPMGKGDTFVGVKIGCGMMLTTPPI